MSRAERPDMTEALQDLGESTRNAAADVGSSMGAVVTAAVLGGHAAVKSAGASVAGTATGAATTAGSGMKSGSTAALGTVSTTFSGAANRARGAVGGTIETMIDKAHSATGGSREQLAVAIQNRRAEKKATTRSAQIAARGAALNAARNRIDQMNERLVSRRASSVTELRDSDRDIDGAADIDGDVDFSNDGDADRNLDVPDSLLTDASPDDGQDDESTIEVVTREPATDESDGEQASVRRRRRVSRREKAAIVASLFEGSEVGDQSDKKSRKKSKKRSGSALKLALLVAIAGAVAAAVRALRPSSSSTGVSIPPKMRPVPDSRSAATTPATTGPGAVVITDSVPTADSGAVDASVDTTLIMDSDAAATTTTFGSGIHGVGTSEIGSSDVGFTDAFAAADADGEPQQTVLADAPEPDDEVVYSTETQHEGRHGQN